jgi:hypothetical protein
VRNDRPASLKHTGDRARLAQAGEVRGFLVHDDGVELVTRRYSPQAAGDTA